MICKECIVEHLIKKTVDSIHFGLFPEEFDFVYDSISEAKERRLGINPMSQQYIDAANSRRALLGVTNLPKNGMSQGGDSRSKVIAWCEAYSFALLNREKDNLSVLLEFFPYNSQKAYQAFSELRMLEESVEPTKRPSNRVNPTKNLSSLFSFAANRYSRLELDECIKGLLALSQWLSDTILVRIHRDIPLSHKLTDIILKEMRFMRNSKPYTINGARAMDIAYQELHRELDSRSYKGERPPRRFRHISMKK